ncbi:MAG: HAMP domain-containing protein [Candidatus Hydrogenedentes bacterium]|nr:HAMP domain-containing protein [Candidatus Hydrogenedentota bacterium]
MTIRHRLILRYGSVVGGCLLLLAGLAHHEFVVEPRERLEMGIPELPETHWNELAEVFFYGMIPVVLGIGWWLMRKTLSPIDEFAHRIECVHTGNLHEPLPYTGRGDEVDRLTKVFNDMMQRLDHTFRHAREFALHASHELKTPLTVMRAEFESLQKDTSRPVSCRECAAGRLDEIQRMAWIVDSLTLLTKADVGLIDIEHKLVMLPDLICECFEDTQILAEPHDVTVVLGECDTAVVTGDRHRLRQLLLNLADNAVKYNRPGGTITLSLRIVGGFAEIAVANTGAGIPPELKGRVFDRFVRGDEARERATDGCGLGLSICQWIAEAHGGTIELKSEPDGLTVVTTRIPTHL